MAQKLKARGLILQLGLPFPRQRDEDVSAALESGFVFGGTAGASLYKTELFKDIGLFDETFLRISKIPI